MYDKDNNPRGFGFVTYENEESVEEVLCSYNKHMLGGKWVDCKKAKPKTPNNNGGSPGGSHKIIGGNKGGLYSGYSPYNQGPIQFDPNFPHQQISNK